MKLILGRTIRFADPAPDYSGQEIPLPERLIIPLKQHSGPAALPTVEKGDEVVEGQVMGQAVAEYDDSAPIHSPVPGKVLEVSSRPDFRGQQVQTVIIEVTGEPSAIPEQVESLPEEIKLTEILAKIKDSGVVPSGLKAPPLSMRLLPTQPKRFLYTDEVPMVQPIDTLVISTMDREPGIHVHRALATNPHPAIFLGVEAMKRLAGATQVKVLADQSLKALDWEAVLGSGENSLTRIDNASYPNGLVEMQVKKATGKQIPLPYGDSRDVGVAFARTETVYWAGMALAGIPQTAKHITVVAPSGLRQLIRVPLGTPVRHILDHFGLQPEDGGKVLLGGRLTGYAIHDMDVPITKEIDGLVLIDPRQVRRFDVEPCFNCGICNRVCPTNLVPGQLSKLCEFDRYEQAEEYDLLHCIECGLCAYVCPAKRPMVHHFRHAKEELMARSGTMKLVVSFSPHSLSRHTIGSYNLTWIACAIPAALAGVWMYGLAALLTLLLTTITAMVVEVIACRMLHREADLYDNHAAMIGFFLGLTLSPATPWWVAIIAAIMAVGLGKWIFGGFGYFPFHPVIVGWVAVYMSFPDLVATYIEPQPGSIWPGMETAASPIMAFRADPSEVYAWSWGQLFIGNYPGPIGASSVLALIIGGLFLFARGYLKPLIPIGFLVGMGVLAAIYNVVDPDLYAPWWWHLMVGQAMLAAILLAPEPTTSPVTTMGMLLFGLGAGITAYFIRIFGLPPDGALFGVLFFNMVGPIVDKIRPKPYGRLTNG